MEVKKKAVPVHNEAQRHDVIWRSGDVTPCFLSLGARLRYAASFTRWPLDPSIDRIITGGVAPTACLGTWGRKRLLLLPAIQLRIQWCKLQRELRICRPVSYMQSWAAKNDV
jgi:hypothetical protein